jgi:hypothetical protein
MIGLPTGTINNIVVIDVDTLQGHDADGFKSLEQLQQDIGQFPKTLTADNIYRALHLYRIPPTITTQPRPAFTINLGVTV